MKKSNNFLTNLTSWIFIISLLVSSYIKYVSVSNYNFPFTIDQGRDLIDVRHMVELLSPRLVGPTTSINGVFLGPFYYYFVSIPFIMFGGSPVAVVYWQSLCFQLGSIFLWWVIKAKSRNFANITASLILLSPIGFYTARYFWNANAMPIFTLLFVATLLKAIWTDKKNWYIALGLICGISLQIEAAFGVIFFPVALIIVYKYLKSKRNYLYLLISFFVTTVPQILFEFRHQFNMTKTLIAGLSGQSEILGQKLSLSERITQRSQIYLDAIRETSHVPFEFLVWVIMLGTVYLIYLHFQKKLKTHLFDLLYISVGFTIFSFVLYLLFSQNLKIWYTLGLPIFITSVLAIVITQISESGIYLKLAALIFLIFTVYHVFVAQRDYIKSSENNPSGGPSNLALQLGVIDNIYKDAEGKSFRVYSYLPSIYDYTYQYLFWWYGRKNYGYMPSDLAYLPGQPEYIENMRNFHQPLRSATSKESIYLIIEKPSVQKFYDDWYGNFSKFCPDKTFQIIPDLKVVKLKNCSK